MKNVSKAAIVQNVWSLKLILSISGGCYQIFSPFISIEIFHKIDELKFALLGKGEVRGGGENG